jgi:hypothetical protein
MSLWLLIALFGLIKLPIAAMMLWLPLRNDAAMVAPDAAGESSDEDGGSRTPPLDPRSPRPRWPRPRGPHHERSPAEPAISAPRRGAHPAPLRRSPRRVSRHALRRRRGLPISR